MLQIRAEAAHHGHDQAEGERAHPHAGDGKEADYREKAALLRAHVAGRDEGHEALALEAIERLGDQEDERTEDEAHAREHGADPHELMPEYEVRALRRRQSHGPEAQNPQRHPAERCDSAHEASPATPAELPEGPDDETEHEHDADADQHDARPHPEGLPEPRQDRRLLPADGGVTAGGGRRFRARCEQQKEWVHHSSGRISGKARASRMEGWQVNAITRRSTPRPKPAAGGMPCSSAST